MNNSETDNQNLAIIARALSYLCITSTDLQNASIGDKAKFLHSIGYPDKEIASLLNTTVNSLRVLRSLKKSKKSKSKSKNKPAEAQ